LVVFEQQDKSETLKSKAKDVMWQCELRKAASFLKVAKYVDVENM